MAELVFECKCVPLDRSCPLLSDIRISTTLFIVLVYKSRKCSLISVLTCPLEFQSLKCRNGMPSHFCDEFLWYMEHSKFLSRCSLNWIYLSKMPLKYLYYIIKLLNKNTFKILTYQLILLKYVLCWFSDLILCSHEALINIQDTRMNSLLYSWHLRRLIL